MARYSRRASAIPRQWPSCSVGCHAASGEAEDCGGQAILPVLSFRTGRIACPPRSENAQRPALHALLLRHPLPDPAVDNRQRQRAGAEDNVVKLADVELVAELLRRVRAQLFELQLTDLVRERLAR